jgi:hypothetical protein
MFMNWPALPSARKKSDLAVLKTEIDEAGKVLNGYMAFLKSRATR